MRKSLAQFCRRPVRAETGIAVCEFLSRRQVVDDHRLAAGIALD
jgi:hypothetical protein